LGGRGTDPVARSTVALGTPLQVVVGPDTFPLAAIGTLDPRNAAAEALSAFLRCATFRRGGGVGVGDKPFALERVFAFWPDAKREIEYPSASITDAAGEPYSEHALTPTALEDSWDAYEPGTVLWKTAEAALTFQVDYWCVDDPTREAIAARLPSLFSPDEGRTGLLLAGDPRYFRRPVRATLLEHERIDTEAAVFGRERRLRTTVLCDVDVVHLRCAVELRPRHVLSGELP
jgi:hypothetical protein